VFRRVCARRSRRAADQENRVFLLVLLVPVVIGAFLLAMEWLELVVLDPGPAASSDDALLALGARAPTEFRETTRRGVRGRRSDNDPGEPLPHPTASGVGSPLP
jgi:hypothetical protein